MNKTEADQKAFFDKLPEAVGGAMKELTDKYRGARDEIQANCDHSKDWFKSQNTERYKTKAMSSRQCGKSCPGLQDLLCHQLTMSCWQIWSNSRLLWRVLSGILGVLPTNFTNLKPLMPLA